MTLNRVGVIGWPVAHSLSPAMHNAAFEALGLTDWRYELLPVEPGHVRRTLNELREQGYVGINVTVPHKEAVIPFVRVDEQARAVGAVNTIDFRTNTGANTDVAGFMDDLAAHGISRDYATSRHLYLANLPVVVLGAGGAARAAVYGLGKAQASVYIVNRTAERAREVAKLSNTASALTIDEVAERFEDFFDSLIVNCTPVGMWPHMDESPWPDDVPFLKRTTVYDMVYRPERTRLMELAEANGGRAIGGLGMLVRQGAAAFKLWTGVEPPVEVMFEAARKQLTTGDSSKAKE